MDGSRALYPSEPNPDQDTMFVLVDLNGSKAGWEEAPEGLERPKDQCTRSIFHARVQRILELPVLERRSPT